MFGVEQLRGEGVAGDGILIGDPEVQHIVVNHPVHLVASEHLHRTTILTLDQPFIAACRAGKMLSIHIDIELNIIETQGKMGVPSVIIGDT